MQVAGRLLRLGQLAISHETIYRHVRRDRKEGVALYTHLRGTRKRRRNRYDAYDGRGRFAGKRMIGGLPRGGRGARERRASGADTVAGSGSKDCALTLVERKTGLVLIASSPAGPVAEPEGDRPDAPAGATVRDRDGRQRD